jgi:ketosteroid isomerase-like protein
MSEQNMAALRAVYGEWARGNFSTTGDLLAPDVVWETGGFPLTAFTPASTALRGPAEIANYTRQAFRHAADYRIEARSFREMGDTILVTERHSARGKASGRETELTCEAFWTFRDDLVSRVRWQA